MPDELKGSGRIREIPKIQAGIFKGFREDAQRIGQRIQMEDRRRRNEMVAKTMKYSKTCACCGKEFISNRKNGRFCSAECRNIIKSKEEAERYRRKKEEKAEAEIVEVKETLVETVKKARDMGMSYGQYKAMIYKKMKGV